MNVEILYKKKTKKLTFNPLRIWYMRNCTWSSVSFWHFTMLLRSAPIKWVTRYLPSIKDCQHIQTATNIRRDVTVLSLCKTPDGQWIYFHFPHVFSKVVCSLKLISHMTVSAYTGLAATSLHSFPSRGIKRPRPSKMECNLTTTPVRYISLMGLHQWIIQI